MNGQNKKVSNTEIKDNNYYLFNNCIAKLVNNDLYIRIYYNSATTRERLNGFKEFGYNISVTQRNSMPYINNKLVEDYYKWYKVEKI